MRLLVSLAFALLTSASEPASAQLLRVSGTYIPSSELVFPSAVTNAVTGSPELEVEITEFSAVGNFPIRLGASTALLVGGRYGVLVANESGAALDLAGQPELHSTSLNLALSHSFDRAWTLLLLAGGGFSSDFVELDAEDALRLQGAGILTHQLESNLRLGGGVLVAYTLGELLPLPAITLDWRITDGLELSLFLPTQADLRWEPHGRVELGLKATLAGDAYDLTSNRNGRWPCGSGAVDNPNTTFDETQADPSRCFERLAYSRLDLGPYVGVRIAGSLWFQIGASVPAFRRYEFLNEDGEIPDIGDFELERNVVLNALIELRIPEKGARASADPTEPAGPGRP